MAVPLLCTFMVPSWGLFPSVLFGFSLHYFILIHCFQLIIFARSLSFFFSYLLHVMWRGYWVGNVLMCKVRCEQGFRASIPLGCRVFQFLLWRVHNSRKAEDRSLWLLHRKDISFGVLRKVANSEEKIRQAINPNIKHSSVSFSLLEMDCLFSKSSSNSEVMVWLIRNAFRQQPETFQFVVANAKQDITSL